METIFEQLSRLDSLFWGYIAFMLIVILGLTLSLRARFFQIRAFPSICKTFCNCLSSSTTQGRGVHPLKAFFASVGGMIGIGNVVGIVTAVQIGGPGALFWVWIAALIGTIIKYSEIFLGLKHRQKNDHGSYDGGPMYFLRSAFNNKWVPIIVSTLLCIYGVEIYVFAVITDTVTTNFALDRSLIIAGLLLATLYAAIGGVSRIGKICGYIMPFFILLYVFMALWIIFQEITLLPGILKTVFVSAFTGHAAIGGFTGSSALLAIQHGVSRAAYSADIGIGYDSIIQSESNTVHPHRQARLAILGVCIDNLVCSLSILVVLVTGIWNAATPVAASQLVQTAMSFYFPYMHIFMPIFLFIVGYTTLIAYFSVGIKCAHFLSPKYGKMVYLFYGVASLIFFSFFDQSHALIIMSISGASLLVINLLGIFMLRDQIDFTEDQQPQDLEQIATS